jgi:hypothetical protein
MLTTDPRIVQWPGRVRKAVFDFRAQLFATAALSIFAVFASTQVQAALRTTRVHHASDSATILAFAGVRDFAERVDTEALMQIPVGADSMVMKARVFVGDQSMGTYAVNIAHVGPSWFRLRSTGRLVAAGESTMCNVDVFVQLGMQDTRPQLGVEQEPLCNGLRHDSAVTRVRNIGS